MKITYEKEDKVFCNFEYKRHNKYYMNLKAIGEVVEVSTNGYYIEFLCHDGIREKKFQNSFHLEPVIERTKKIMDNLYEEIESTKSILVAIKECYK